MCACVYLLRRAAVVVIKSAFPARPAAVGTEDGSPSGNGETGIFPTTGALLMRSQLCLARDFQAAAAAAPNRPGLRQKQVPVGSLNPHPLGSYRIGSYRIGSYRLGCCRLGSYRLGSYRLGSYSSLSQTDKQKVPLQWKFLFHFDHGPSIVCLSTQGRVERAAVDGTKTMSFPGFPPYVRRLGSLFRATFCSAARRFYSPDLLSGLHYLLWLAQRCRCE